MKIVFSAGQCEKNLGTTTKLLYAVSQCLAAKGHKCYILGAAQYESGHDIDADGVEIIRFINQEKKMACIREAHLDYQKYAQIYHNTLGSKLKYAVLHPGKAMLLRKEDTTREGYGKEAAEIIRKIKPDAVICMQDPVKETKDLIDHLKDYNGILGIYQVDPWGLWDQDKIIGDARSIEEELRAIHKVDFLVTTKEMYRQHQIRPEYQKYLYKVLPADFPNMSKKDTSADSPIQFDPSRINILYTGSLQRHRSPVKFLELLETLLEEDERICCHFIGSIDRSCMAEFLDRHPDRFFLYPPASPEQVYRAMKETDILLNVGNSYTNMVPSKIFDYFSMGKPIINTQKNKYCPAREYFDRYPRCLTLEEWHIGDYKQKLIDFLGWKDSEDLPYEYLEKLYIESTPEYVANLLLDTLEGNRHG